MAIKQYVKNTYGDAQGLVYSSEEAARAMVESGDAEFLTVFET